MAQQIKASVSLQAKIKKTHLTSRQLAFADLLAIGYHPKDAYQLCGLYDDILIPATNWKNMRSLMSDNAAFCNYVPDYVPNDPSLTTKKKGKSAPIVPNEPEVPQFVPEQAPSPSLTNDVGSRTISDEEMAEMLSKDNQLKELLWKLKHEQLDTQTELQIRKMIADLTNAKKEQVQIEDKRTIFYLPLKCHQCSLYLKAKNQQQNK